jgi:hypothetical protein
LNIRVCNTIVTRILNVQKCYKKPRETHRGLNIAILLVITLGIVLPFFLPQGFVPVLAILKIGVVDKFIPLFRISIDPQEKEPPDSLL